jgi:hypothetical protein
MFQSNGLGVDIALAIYLSPVSSACGPRAVATDSSTAAGEREGIRDTCLWWRHIVRSYLPDPFRGTLLDSLRHESLDLPTDPGDSAAAA